jgi:hypothetical protein
MVVEGQGVDCAGWKYLREEWCSSGSSRKESRGLRSLLRLCEGTLRSSLYAPLFSQALSKGRGRKGGRRSAEFMSLFYSLIYDWPVRTGLGIAFTA